MSQTRTYKKTMNFVYGMGAAVVIIGALFKIQHFNLNVFGLFEITGGLMLTIGLIVEAIVFAISAFDTPEDDLDWSKVYPELGDASLTSEKEEDTQGLLAQKLDSLLQEAKIDVSLMQSLGASIKNFQGAAEGLSAASESISSTNSYNEQMSLAATQMETLYNLYKLHLKKINFVLKTPFALLIFLYSLQLIHLKQIDCLHFQNNN